MNVFASPLVLLLVPGLPLLPAMGLMSGPLRRGAIPLALWAVFPALAASLALTPSITLELPWLLFGTLLGFGGFFHSSPPCRGCWQASMPRVTFDWPMQG